MTPWGTFRPFKTRIKRARRARGTSRYTYRRRPGMEIHMLPLFVRAVVTDWDKYTLIDSAGRLVAINFSYANLLQFYTPR